MNDKVEKSIYFPLLCFISPKVSGCASSKKFLGQDIFHGGGDKTLKKSLVLTTSGRQDPQKVIGFEHFIHERKCPYFLDFTESYWPSGGKTFFLGGGGIWPLGAPPPHPPLAPPLPKLLYWHHTSQKHIFSVFAFQACFHNIISLIWGQFCQFSFNPHLMKGGGSPLKVLFLFFFFS